MVSPVNRILIWMKSAYTRITLTKITISFFLFTFAYCFAHALVQSLLFGLDSDACSLTSTIISTAKVPLDEFAWLSQRRDETTHSKVYTLKICDKIPFEKSKEEDPCTVVFQSDDRGVGDEAFRKRQSDGNPTSDITEGSLGANFTEAIIQPIFDPNSNNISRINLTNPAINGGQPVSLDVQCTRVLLYAEQVLNNAKREEWALIASEFWLLWTSVFALLYGSISHLFAALAFRVLSVGWSAYSIWRTHDIDHRFNVLVTEGACGVDLFPEYFKQRMAIQIADLTLNVVAMLVLSYLVVRLARTYRSFMFRCVGPPEHVVRTYRFVLGLFTCLQISVYFLITSTALWLDQLLNGAIASISSHTALYLTIFITTLILLLPWIMIGWRSVRLEQRRALLFFVALGLLFEAGWSVMYDSLVWRWTWIQWPFFASLAVAAQFIILASVVLGIICRMNFGKGLKEYLQAANALEKEDFEPEMFESTDRKSQSSGDDGWDPDLEKMHADRLSQTLDFGAHQPPPPLSPHSHMTRFSVISLHPPAPLVSNVLSRSHLTDRSERPQSFTSVLPTLPTLGKFAPWESTTGHENHP